MIYLNCKILFCIKFYVELKNFKINNCIIIFYNIIIIFQGLNNDKIESMLVDLM